MNGVDVCLFWETLIENEIDEMADMVSYAARGSLIEDVGREGPDVTTSGDRTGP